MWSIQYQVTVPVGMLDTRCPILHAPHSTLNTPNRRLPTARVIRFPGELDGLLDVGILHVRRMKGHVEANPVEAGLVGVAPVAGGGNLEPGDRLEAEF